MRLAFKVLLVILPCVLIGNASVCAHALSTAVLLAAGTTTKNKLGVPSTSPRINSTAEKFSIIKGDQSIFICKGSEVVELSVNVLVEQRVLDIKRSNHTEKLLSGIPKIEADAIFGIFKLPLGSFLGVITSSIPYPDIGDGVGPLRLQV
jgi:hypothetical protein